MIIRNYRKLTFNPFTEWDRPQLKEERRMETIINIFKI